MKWAWARTAKVCGVIADALIWLADYFARLAATAARKAAAAGLRNG